MTFFPVGSAEVFAWIDGPKKESPNLYVEIKVGESAAQSTWVAERNLAPDWFQEFIMYV